MEESIEESSKPAFQCNFSTSEDSNDEGLDTNTEEEDSSTEDKKEENNSEDEEQEVNLDERGRFTMPLPPDEYGDSVNKEQATETSSERENDSSEYIQHIKVRKRFKGKRGNQPSFFKCIQQVFEILERFSKSNIELVSFEENDFGRGIQSFDELLKYKTSWKKFAAGYHFNNKTGFIFIHVKVEMSESLYKMKRNGSFFRELKERSMFLDRQWINTVFPVRFAGLLYSHYKYTDVIQAMYHINSGIDENQEKEIQVQVVPHIMFVGKRQDKHFTKLMALECDRDDLEAAKKRLQSLFIELPHRGSEANIGRMRLMPLRADNVTDVETVIQLVKLQQQYIMNIEGIHVFNIKRLDWVLPHMDGINFKKHLLEARHKKDKSILLRSIEKVEEDDTIILMVDRKKKTTFKNGWR